MKPLAADQGPLKTKSAAAFGPQPRRHIGADGLRDQDTQIWRVVGYSSPCYLPM